MKPRLFDFLAHAHLACRVCLPLAQRSCEEVRQSTMLPKRCDADGGFLYDHEASDAIYFKSLLAHTIW